MRKLLALLGAAAALAFAAPAAATISATYLNNYNSGSGTVSSSTGQDITISPAAGTLVVAVIDTWSAPTAVTCSDNLSDTWTTIAVYNAGGNGEKMWVCYLPNAPSGVTKVNVKPNSSVQTIAAVASFTNIATTSPEDASGHGAGVNGASTQGPASVSSGATLAQADELLIQFWVNGGGTQVTNYTPGTGWTQIGTLSAGGVQEASGNYGLQWAWLETSSTAQVTASVSWTPSETYGLRIYAFKAAAGGGGSPKVCTLNLLGVGKC